MSDLRKFCVLLRTIIHGFGVRRHLDDLCSDHVSKITCQVSA